MGAYCSNAFKKCFQIGGFCWQNRDIRFFHNIAKFIYILLYKFGSHSKLSAWFLHGICNALNAFSCCGCNKLNLFSLTNSLIYTTLAGAFRNEYLALLLSF